MARVDLKSMSREDKIKLVAQLRDKIEILKGRRDLKKAQDLAVAFENNPSPARLQQQPTLFEKMTDVGYLEERVKDFGAGVAQGGKAISGVLDKAIGTYNRTQGLPPVTVFGVLEKGIDKLKEEHEGLPGYGAGEFVGKAAEGLAVYAPIAAGVAATGGAGTLAAPFLAGIATSGLEQANEGELNPAAMLANAAMFSGLEAGVGAFGAGAKQIKIAKRAGKIKEARNEAYTKLFDEADQFNIELQAKTNKQKMVKSENDFIIKQRESKAARLAEVLKMAESSNSVELAAFGITPNLLSETMTSIDNAARSIGNAVLPDALKATRSVVKAVESKGILSDIGSIEERAAVNIIGPATEALRKAGLYSLKNRIFSSNLKSIATSLRNNVPSKYRDVLEYVHKQAKDAGIAIGHRSGYYPQILSQKYSDAFLNDFHPILERIRQGGEVTDTYIKNAIAEGVSKKIISKESISLIDHLVKDKKLTYTDAVEYLYGEAQPGVLPVSRFTKNRLITLGEQFTENNAAVALTKYVESMGRYIEQAKTWGKDGQLLTAKLNKLKNESPFEHAKIQELLDVYNGHKYSEYWSKKGIKTRQFWQNYSAFTYLTKIGMGLSTIPQTMQVFGTNAARAGYLRTSVAYFRSLFPSNRAAMRSIGLVNPDLMAVFGGYHPAGSLATAADIAATVNQFKGINRLNLYTSALTAEGAIKKWYTLANQSGEKASQLWARNNLRRVNLDWTKPLTDDVLHQKMYRYAMDSQLMKNIVDEPAFLNSPSMSKLLLLKRFGVKQAQAIKHIVLDDAVLKNSKGMVVGYNPLPMARLALFGYGSGEAIIWARNIIKQSLSGNPQYRKADIDTAERIAEDFAMSGAFGIISDISGLFDTESSLSAKKKLMYAFAPTIANDIYNIAESNIALGEYWKRHDDGGLALKKKMSALTQPLGSIVSQLAQRTKTAGQRRSEIETLRGNERSAILDLFIEGKTDKAIYRMSQFNKNYPEFGFGPDDINYKAMKSRVKTQLENTVKEGID